MGTIKRYENNVFTNDGQSTVDQFDKDKLDAKAAAALSQVPSLTVYAGYHGDPNGGFSAKFNATEMAQVCGMVSRFPNATLEVLTAEMPNDKIIAAAKKGSVFFTWCDSDKKVTSVMHSQPLVPEPL